MKVRVSEGLTVNSLNSEDLEIKFEEKTKSGVFMKYFVKIGLNSIPALIKELKNFLKVWDSKPFKTEWDELDITGGGTDMDPSIAIHSRHLENGKREGYTLFFPEKDGPALVAALEKIAREKNLR